MTYDPHDDETRVTDRFTGGQKGAKLTQLGALDPLALVELARVAGYGANKYAAFNYLKGYDWALSFNAMMRHSLLFWNGENTDPESGLNHMAHAAWMALSLVSFAIRELGTDTRFVQAPSTDASGPPTGAAIEAAFKSAMASDPVLRDLTWPNRPPKCDPQNGYTSLTCRWHGLKAYDP